MKHDSLTDLILDSYKRNRARNIAAFLSCLLWPPNLWRLMKRHKFEIEERQHAEQRLMSCKCYCKFLLSMIKMQSEELQKDRLAQPQIRHDDMHRESICIYLNVDQREVLLSGVERLARRLSVECVSLFTEFCGEHGLEYLPPVKTSAYYARRDLSKVAAKKLLMKTDDAGRRYVVEVD